MLRPYRTPEDDPSYLDSGYMKPNVVLLVMDSARAKTVLPGMDDGCMPALDSLATEGTTFTDAMTTAPWTVPSHASMFTGQYTSAHGAHAGTRSFDPDVPALPALLASGGYTTAGISANPWLSPELGFDRGFDRFSMAWDRGWNAPDLSLVSEEDSLPGMLGELYSRVSLTDLHRLVVNGAYAKLLWTPDDTGAARMTSRALEFVRERGDEPFFLFLNYMEPHIPYDPPAEFRKRFLPDDLDPSALDRANQDAWAYVFGDVSMSETEFRALTALYQAELNYLDTQIARLVDGLYEMGLEGETAVIVTSDHGENIGEHGLMDHQYSLYETLLHVPLVVRYPGVVPEGRTVDGLVEMRDLYPTVLDLAGVDLPSDRGISGNSLVAEGGPPTRVQTISQYLVPQPPPSTVAERLDDPSSRVETFDRALSAIRTAEWKLIVGSDGSRELYDVSDDRSETEDVSGANPETVEELRGELERVVGEPSKPGTDPKSLSRESRRRLSDLGYLE